MMIQNTYIHSYKIKFYFYITLLKKYNSIYLLYVEVLLLPTSIVHVCMRYIHLDGCIKGEKLQKLACINIITN